MVIRDVILEMVSKGYSVSKDGNVLNPKGMVLKGCLHPSGYLKVGVRTAGRSSYAVKIHKFVAYAKFGDKVFDKGVCVRHLDGNPTNNNWDNIAIGSHSDNMMDKSPEQRRRDASSPKHDHAAIIADNQKGMTYPELMKKYDITSKGTLSYIIRKSMASVA